MDTTIQGLGLRDRTFVVRHTLGLVGYVPGISFTGIRFLYEGS